MAITYLGEVIDVHGGGGDLSFPHHECETAQARGVTGEEKFAHFWMHAAMVRYEGEKMSKSLGNLIWVRDLLQEHTPDAVRILVTSHPYYETWEYDDAELIPADALADLLLRAAQATGGAGQSVDPQEDVAAFEAAMDDNLNSRVALAALERLARRILDGAAAGNNIADAQRTLHKLATVFGLRLGAPLEPRVEQGWDAHHKRFE